MMTSDCLSPTAFRRLLTRAVVVPPTLLGVLALVFLGQIAYLLSTAAWIDHTDQVIARTHGLLKLLVDGETGARGYLLTGDPVFLEPYHVEETQCDPAFDALSELVSDNPPQVVRLAALRADHADWRGYARRLIEPGRSAGGQDTIAQITDGKRRMDAMREQIAEFIRIEEDLREERTRTARRATWAVAGASLSLASLIGVVMAGMTRRQLVRVSESYRGALAAAELRAESLRKSAHRLETLHDIDRAILAAESMPELVGSALRRLKYVAPGDAFVVAFDGPRVFGRDREMEADPALVSPTEPSEQNGPRVVPDLEASRAPLHDYLYRAGHRSCVTVPLDTDGRRVGFLVLADPEPSAFTEEHRQVAHEIARQLAIAFQHTRMREQLHQHAADLERRVEERTRELQESLGRVRQLQGLLPICAWCKKVRDEEDYWHQVEHYIAAHSDTKFSHGICPACLRDIMDKQGQQVPES